MINQFRHPLRSRSQLLFVSVPRNEDNSHPVDRSATTRPCELRRQRDFTLKVDAKQGTKIA